MNHFSVRAQKTVAKLRLDSKYVEYRNGIKIAHVEENGVSYKRTDLLAALDWDWPNVAHKDNTCVTIQDFGEVVDLLEPWLAKHRDQTVRLYETPGGVRGLFVSKRQTVRDFVALGLEELNSDPHYIRLSVQRQAFGLRVSPKLCRSGDYVARYVCTLGVDEDLEVMEVVRDFHDCYLL